MTNQQIKQRIEELTSKIPVGTYCSEDNCCGGYLTAAEEAELNSLLEAAPNYSPIVCDECQQNCSCRSYWAAQETAIEDFTLFLVETGVIATAADADEILEAYFNGE